MHMDDESCPACTAEAIRQNALRPAARHPALRGSRFVGSRGVRDLFVCRECGALWRTWYDQREGCRCWSSSGRTIVPVFASDTSLTRLVDWVATDYSRASFSLTVALATKLIRRKPEGLQEGVTELVRRLGALSPPSDAISGERLEMLFHLLGLAAERSIRGDLRPEGPRVKPPTRYRDAEVKEAAKRFEPREVEGLTHLNLTHDVVRRLLWEARWGPGPDSPEHAVIAVHDPSPILRFLDQLPLGAVQDGVLRGIYAETAFEAAGRIHGRGRLPENDHAIWLPREGWNQLEKLVDPLRRLAASWRRIRESEKCAPAERLARVQVEALLVREPIRRGARFTNLARGKLEEIEGQLERESVADDSRSLTALREILDLEKRGLEADGRCMIGDLGPVGG
jgi:hypothetical protein